MTLETLSPSPPHYYPPMLPETENKDEPFPENFDDLDYFSELWYDLEWSPWVPFDAPREFWYIPKEPGVYRIRPIGKDFLMYIDETGRSLSELLSELRQTLRRRELMPWNNPHAVAPGLWAWQDAEGYEYEISAAPLDASTAGRRGMEHFLLYRYRQETGESPLCNFGRFHPRYRRSSSHKDNLRGGKLADGHKDNPAGFPSIPPLEPLGKAGDPDWMGLEWTKATPFFEADSSTVAPMAGLFLLSETGSGEVFLIGQSGDIAQRLDELRRKVWDGRDLQFSYQVLGQKVLPHNLRELECDLIGNFYEQNKKAPEFQFRKSW
jgi:hypothetical protein